MRVHWLFSSVFFTLKPINYVEKFLHKLFISTEHPCVLQVCESLILLVWKSFQAGQFGAFGVSSRRVVCNSQCRQIPLFYFTSDGHSKKKSMHTLPREKSNNGGRAALLHETRVQVGLTSTFSCSRPTGCRGEVATEFFDNKVGHVVLTFCVKTISHLVIYLYW